MEGSKVSSDVVPWSAYTGRALVLQKGILMSVIFEDLSDYGTLENLKCSCVWYRYVLCCRYGFQNLSRFVRDSSSLEKILGLQCHLV